MANPAFDSAGNPVGTTHGDGAYNEGAVFTLTPGAGNWTYTSLHDFAGGNDGGYLRCDDKNGNMEGLAATVER
jgi:hypothetical protein